MPYLMSITLKSKKRRKNKCKPVYMISMREKGMIQETSIESYYDMLPHLNNMHNMFYNLLKVYPGCSNNDLSRISNHKINVVTPRVNELRKRGLVKFSHYKTDRITKRRVMCWVVA